MSDPERPYTFADLVHEGASQSQPSATEISLADEEGGLRILRVPQRSLLPTVVTFVESSLY